MKNKKQILLHIAEKRHSNTLKRNKLKKLRKRKLHLNYINFKRKVEGKLSYTQLIDLLLPTNLKFLISCVKSDFHYEKLKRVPINQIGIYIVPNEFSIIDYPETSFGFIQKLLSALLMQKHREVVLDYNNCVRLDLGAQVFLDIIIKDILTFYKKLEQYPNTKVLVKAISGKNINNPDVQKLLFSVGSPAIHFNNHIRYNDIIPYKLCVHNREKDGNKLKNMERKDIDTTELADYVITSLERLNKKLSPEKIDDLCTVIGEILINAEEHSTTNYRFSIGYFHEIFEKDKHYGVFRLVIMNLGNTIYEKFKDPDCPNKTVVTKMRKLSESYTRRNFFSPRKFEEETLWTLYALQDAVTSVSPEKYKRRGNGSIRFIDSFFNITGRKDASDDYSKLVILSGNTNITFDGKYDITERIIDNEKFKQMTFNNSGKIIDLPDKNYVKFVDNYFPGTIISAKILFNEDDLILNDE